MISGAVVTVFSIAIYRLLLYFNIDYHISNLVSLISSKVLAYFLNKLFVFRSHVNTFWKWLKELIQFVFARGGTFFIDYFGVMLFVDVFKFDAIFSKYFFVILVIILNYFFGKIIFKGEKHETKQS